MTFTVMRTGALEQGGGGGGLRLGEVDQAVCAAVSKTDVFRFVTEALTLPEASGRLFSLCPSDETEDSLRQIRLSGLDRRTEVAALLSGKVVEAASAESVPAASIATTPEGEQVQSELEAEHEEELRALIARGRKRLVEKAEEDEQKA